MAKSPIIPANTPNDGFPSNWKPIDTPPVFANAPASAPPVGFPGPSPYYAASLPLTNQLVPDIMPTRFTGGIGGYRIMPPGASGSANLNAGARSIVIEEGGSTIQPAPGGGGQPPLLPTNCPCMSGGAISLTTNYTATGANNGQLLSFSSAQPIPYIKYTQYTGTLLGSTLTFAPFPTADGDLIVVSCWADSNQTCTGVADSATGNYLLAASHELIPMSGNTAYQFYQENSDASTANIVTMSFSGSVLINAFLWVVGNVATTQALDTTAYGYVANNPGTVTTALFTTNFPIEMGLVGCVIDPNNDLCTAGPGYTGDFSSGIFVAEHALFLSQQIGATASYTNIDTQSGLSTGLIGTYKALQATTLTVTLPNPPPFPKWTIAVQNAGTGTLVINPNGLDINGSSSNVTLSAGEGATIFTDAFNYFTETGTGAFANPMTTLGDMIYENTSLAPARLPIGTSGQFLMVSGGIPAWETPSLFTNPMTTAQDLIVGGSSGAPTRLGVGTSAQVLTVSGAGAVEWANPSSGFTNPMTTAGDIIIENATPAPDRLGIGTTGQVLTVVGGLPAWAAAGGGGTPFFTSNPEYTVNASSSAFATKGIVAECFQAITISRLIGVITASSGNVYQAYIIAVSSLATPTITSVIASSNSYTFTTSATIPVVFTFSSPPTLTVGDVYFIGVGITSGTGTTICAIDTTTSFAVAIPGMNVTANYARIATVSPTSGTFSTGSGPYVVTVIGSL